MKRTYMIVTVEKYGRIRQTVEIEKTDALDAILWMKKHNGHAPQSVHDLIRVMEVACRLAEPIEV